MSLPRGSPNPIPISLTYARLCLRAASTLCSSHFVKHDSKRVDLPDSRRVFDLDATHRQIVDRQAVEPLTGYLKV
jgi:hypothetical protein